MLTWPIKVPQRTSKLVEMTARVIGIYPGSKLVNDSTKQQNGENEGQYQNMISDGAYTKK